MLSEDDFKHGDHCNKVMGNLDDLSLNVMDEDVKTIEHEINNLRVASLKCRIL